MDAPSGTECMRRSVMSVIFLGLQCLLLACIAPSTSAEPPSVSGIAGKAATAVKGLVASPTCNSPTPAKLPKHVFVIVLENEGYDETFAPSAPPSHLKDLAKQGLLLTNYYGIGHNSLDNYIAMISGQAPNKFTQADCPTFIDFIDPGEEVKNQLKLKQRQLLSLHPHDHELEAAHNDQQMGQGCVYPANISTVADQLSKNNLTWRAYMDSMARPCQHPGKLEGDFKEGHYRTKHNPFVFFRSIIGQGPADATACTKNDVPLGDIAGTGDGLIKDLETPETFPNFVFITPDMCHDGHDNCGDKNDPQAKMKQIGDFLKLWVPKIQASKSYKNDGMIIITFDEAEVWQRIPKGKTLSQTMAYNKQASKACCDEQPGPGTEHPGGPLANGPGGGKIGAIVLSPFVEPGENSAEFNHYSMLRSIEDLFGLGHLGFANAKQLRTFQECGVFKADSSAPPSTGTAEKPHGS